MKFFFLFSLLLFTLIARKDKEMELIQFLMDHSEEYGQRKLDLTGLEDL